MDSMTSYCSGIFRVVGQPTRVDIIESLRDGEMYVRQILSSIGHEQSNTSRHISIMYQNGLLASRRDGHKTLYRLKHREQLLGLIDSAKKRRLTDSHYAETLKVLGQPTRMKIVEILSEGEVPLSDIHDMVGGEQTNNAHHLTLMLDAGIVATRREKGRSLYRLANPEYILSLVGAARLIIAQETSNRQRFLV